MNQQLKKRIDKFNNPEAVRFFFGLLKTLINDANINETDERLTINVRNDYRKRISVSINSRLVLFIQKDVQFGLLLNEAYLDQVEHIPILKKETFARQQPAALLLYFDYNVVKSHIETILPLWLQSCQQYLPAQEKSQYRHHHIGELYEIATNQELLEDYLKNSGTVNVKLPFIHWMMKTDGSERKYFSSQFGSDQYRFTKEINEYEDVYRQHFNAELFLVFPENVDGKLEELRANLYSKDGEFSEYNRKKASGRPTAILGTQNYFKFLQEFFQSKQPTEKASLRQKLLPYIDRYKKLISEPGLYNEIYKWESLQNFQDHWDLSAQDLPQMIERALPGSNNLWSSNNYYPVAMLKGFAEFNPRAVSDAIKALYDESKPLASRIETYRSDMDKLLEEDNRVRNAANKFNYQDGRTIALLLAFQYPDIHFLYKFNILKSFCNKFGYEAPKKGDVINQVLVNESINSEVKEILEDDDDLLKLHEMRLTPNAYRDDNNNLLTQDFMYATVTYLNDDAKYYLAGAFWDTSTPQDQTSRFVEEGIWVNGYTDKFNDDVKKVKPGSRIAIKSAFVREKTKSVMAIKARGVVTENLNDGQTLQVDWEQNFVPFEVSFGGYLTTIKEVVNDAHIELIWHEQKPRENDMASDDDLKGVPLNLIMYGPPGTGKTYNTVLEAAKIVSKNLNLKYNDAKAIFKANLGDQIEFITFHQNYSYEDFIQGLRPDTENGNVLTFEKKDGVFKRISEKALKNLEASKNPAAIKKDFDLVFNELIMPLSEGEIEIQMKKSSFYITEVGERSIEFRKNIGESQHTLSINTLRKMYDRGENDIILGGLQPYYNPILERLLEMGKNTVTSVPKKNFVIIIDEINRANISRVFGELITLIEEDKRSDGEIPMQVTLPSGDTFIVPSNLYIIGTMNTADKSIALLDIALRRRFEFKPMYPQYQIEGATIHHPEVLEELNKRICKVKNNRDFQIGHAYFMERDCLATIMNKKVIPLLLEYFMNNEDEVRKIIEIQGYRIDTDCWPMKFCLN